MAAQNRSNNPARPALKPIVRGAAFAQAGHVERTPLATRAPHEEDRPEHPAWLRRFAPATAGMPVVAHGNQRLYHRPQFIAHAPLVSLGHAKLKSHFIHGVQYIVRCTLISRIGS